MVEREDPVRPVAVPVVLLCVTDRFLSILAGPPCCCLLLGLTGTGKRLPERQGSGQEGELWLPVPPQAMAAKVVSSRHGFSKHTRATVHPWTVYCCCCCHVPAPASRLSVRSALPLTSTCPGRREQTMQRALRGESRCKCDARPFAVCITSLLLWKLPRDCGYCTVGARRSCKHPPARHARATATPGPWNPCWTAGCPQQLARARTGLLP